MEAAAIPDLGDRLQPLRDGIGPVKRYRCQTCGQEWHEGWAAFMHASVTVVARAGTPLEVLEHGPETLPPAAAAEQRAGLMATAAGAAALVAVLVIGWTMRSLHTRELATMLAVAAAGVVLLVAAGVVVLVLGAIGARLFGRPGR